MGVLDNRVAVITGGVSGIGRITAQQFLQQGAKVVIADINEERGAQAAKDLSGYSNDVAFVPVDVTSEQSQEALFAQTLELFGQIDVAVAAAGVSSANYVSGEVSEMATDPAEMMLHNRDLADWQKVLDINLTGVMLTDRYAVREMLKRGSGSIINIASIAGQRPLPGASDYCVSKAGVIMLTKVLAEEMSQLGVRVNAIGPGFIETPMTASIRQSPEWMDTVMTMTPMQRFGRPEEIANTVMFLASDGSSYFNGQTLFPNGGMFVG